MELISPGRALRFMRSGVLFPSPTDKGFGFDGYWEREIIAEKLQMVNFIAAFQCDFSQSLHLAFFLRYAERSARREIKHAITTAMLGVCKAQLGTVSCKFWAPAYVEGAKGTLIARARCGRHSRNTDFPQE